MVKVREIDVSLVSEVVKGLFLKAGVSIGQDVYNALVHARDKREKSPLGRSVLDQILRNHDLARVGHMPLCQDTGMAVVFADVGQEVLLVGGDFAEAVDSGVEEAYREGYFRKSIVVDPLFDRRNTGTNTPAVLHTRVVPGDRVRLLATPKGFGGENMSALRVLTPGQGPREVLEFVRDTVEAAGPNPCPPTLVGVGIGGTVEVAALMAKRATLYPVGRRNPDGQVRRTGTEDPGSRERPWDRAGRAGGKCHLPGHPHGIRPRPYRGNARGGQHLLPCGPAR